MRGSVSRIVRFDNEEEFIDEMQAVFDVFSELSSRYGGGDVIEGIILWDTIGIQDDEGIKIFRVGEFQMVRGSLNLPVEKIFTLERFFDEMESKWDELSVEDIKYFVDLMNESLGEERVYYDAYDLGLERGEAYIVINLRSLQYLDHVVDVEDREAFEWALSTLMKYI
ncbi:hypothetical protein PFDSM3638_04585 [Pyrococcus furiosus DSM 3638]|uniref:Uncharacterized protein n=3 Tax=Pyrococcus furiosus TaxID=2261 RepID=A0A5C0XNS3_PYRFU|nr:hypothetical protein [Pyrococcus furiosus]AAL81041.1 hypothetical protein PF0917 [Pyrococcus furiosus DSM 3638]AFN03710.1 hypothetical protein PFC_03805 [Pyrococcus furiosus COM1]QEK78583.1 hypothetical protein PFDSM3638_04585 [Pyrococcus furiosus DSM 3638]